MALQDSARLRQFQLQPADWQVVRQLGQQPAFAQVPLQLALSDLAAALAHARRGHEAYALAASLPAPMPTITAIRVGEQAMLVNDRSQQAALDSFLTGYQQEVDPQLAGLTSAAASSRPAGRYQGAGSPQPLKVANSVIPLLYWQPDENSREAISFRQCAADVMREGRSETQETGPVGMCWGRSLADHSYQALRDIPAYQAERLRARCFTRILAGLAHLKTSRPGDGWRAYDELRLPMPVNYNGP